MEKIIQKVVKRNSHTVDEGTMGFHDYEKKKEDFEVFVNRVSDIANEILKNDRYHIIKSLYVTYPNEDIAVIAYRGACNTGGYTPL